MKTKIVITSGERWDYFQYFLLGFYELERSGKIILDFKLPVLDNLLHTISNPFIVRVINKIRNEYVTGSYNMDGYIIDGGKKRTFTIDCADSPYLFDENRLRAFDIYFKIQCPIDLDKSLFELSEKVAIPWIDCKQENGIHKTIKKLPVKKIKPLMQGPRRLAQGISYRSLKAGYNSFIRNQINNKSKNIMCYFGNALGPKAKDNPIANYDSEEDLMGYFSNKLSHPNEKRAKVADIISKMSNCDARVISSRNADSKIIEKNELIIPLAKFCEHISHFKWNVNVSGYRMSIPNRFIESFMVGTGIVTDKLAVRWYKPFNEEVYETVAMGYLPMKQVDWDKFKYDMNHLPKLESKKVVAAFENKWSPIVVAQYIIDTVKGE